MQEEDKKLYRLQIRCIRKDNYFLSRDVIIFEYYDTKEECLEKLES